LLVPSIDNRSHALSAVMPSLFDDDFNVTVSFEGGRLSAVFRVLSPSTGPPSSLTQVRCQPSVARASSIQSCRIVFVSSPSVGTSMFPDEFSVIASVQRSRSVDSSIDGLQTFDGGASYLFDLSLPSVASFVNLTVLVGSEPLTFLGIPVFAFPAPASILDCVTESGSNDVVRSLEAVYCIIRTADESGPSRSIASDFLVRVNDFSLRSSQLLTTDGGATFNISLTAPNSSLSTFVVSAFTDRDVALIVGSPWIFRVQCLLFNSC
jgi:hypothetical protein